MTSLASTPVLVQRRVLNALFQALCGICAVIAIAVLGYVLWFLFRQGITYFKPSFFTRLPDNVNPVLGGIKHSILGSVNILGIALSISIPIGILSGVYQAEANGKLCQVVRFLTDVLNGIPSIVIGLFIYAIWILPYAQKHPGQGYSGIAGGAALGIMMIPLVMRTTDEMLHLVPQSLWDASLALGTPRWRTMLFVVLPSARNGIVTGVMLALARVAGETAPLLFTSLGNLTWSIDMTKPMGSLPVTIYTYAGSPYADWIALGWTGALLITLGVLAINIIARVVLRQRS
jgi:phosphate transport system permease protein